MYRVVTVKERKRKVGVGGIHYYNHFTSLGKVALERKKSEKTEREREESGGKSLSWLLVNLKRNFIFQPLLLCRTSTQSIHTITKDISAVY